MEPPKSSIKSLFDKLGRVPTETELLDYVEFDKNERWLRTKMNSPKDEFIAIDEQYILLWLTERREATLRKFYSALSRDSIFDDKIVILAKHEICLHQNAGIPSKIKYESILAEAFLNASHNKLFLFANPAGFQLLHMRSKKANVVFAEFTRKDKLFVELEKECAAIISAREIAKLTEFLSTESSNIGVLVALTKSINFAELQAHNMNWCYIVYIGQFTINGTTVHIFKYGRTEKIDNRLATHAITFDGIEPICVVCAKSGVALENAFKEWLDANKIRTSMEFNGKNQVELFYSTPEHPIQQIYHKFNQLAALGVPHESLEVLVEMQAKQIEMQTKQIEQLIGLLSKSIL